MTCEIKLRYQTGRIWNAPHNCNKWTTTAGSHRPIFTVRHLATVRPGIAVSCWWLYATGRRRTRCPPPCHTDLWPQAYVNISMFTVVLSLDLIVTKDLILDIQDLMCDVCVRARARTCACVCMYACMYVFIYVCMHVCTMYVCMYVCIYVCVYVCMYVCMHASMYVFMYVYTCTFVLVAVTKFMFYYLFIDIQTKCYDEFHPASILLY
jgi:hypothetical protein